MANIVGGINLNTLGLRLMRVDGNLDLPAYKKIVEKQDLPERLRKTEENKITVRLFGNYATKNALVTAVQSFHSILNGSIAVVWQLDAHGINSYFVCKGGTKVEIFGKAAQITVVINETEQPS